MHLDYFSFNSIICQKFEYDEAELRDLEKATIQILRKALNLGRPVIITNAKMEWVHFSMISFFHKVYEFILKENIPIISAQDIFGYTYNNPVHWKVQSFRQLLIRCEIMPQKLISIGDGLHEKVACSVVCEEFSVAGVHVQFATNPTPQEIISQLSDLHHTLEELAKDCCQEKLFTCIFPDHGRDMLLTAMDIV